MARRRERRRESPRPGADPAHADPPTVVSWEVDYWYGFPLVNASPGAPGVDVLDAGRLGIPEELGERLADWADRWEDLAMRDVRGEPPADWAAEAEARLARDQWALLDEVRLELEGRVGLLVDGLAFDEWRERQRRPGG